MSNGQQSVLLSDLTPRQAEVLALLSKGLTNPAIAEALGVTVGAVSSFVSVVCKRVAPDVPGNERRAVAARWYKANVPPPQATGWRSRGASESKQLARECRSRLETAAIAAIAKPHPEILREAAEWGMIVLALRLVPFSEEAE